MKIGIWIDSREAYLIKASQTDQKVDCIKSEIENFNPKGGSRSNVPYGPVETVSESKYHERRHHQEVKFFDKIIEAIKNEDQVLLFGPAQTKVKLANRIEARNDININVAGCQDADSMTENQKIAYVKSFYGLPIRKKNPA